MTSIADARQSGVFALVSYVPDPLGSFLTELRRSMPGAEIPQPHITILPPRPLLLPVETASQQAKAKLESFTRFEVELGMVHLFGETGLLYLDIEGGTHELQTLHDSLNTDALHHMEQFEYSPHLTIGGPFPDQDLEAGLAKAEETWNGSALSRSFTIAEIVFLYKAEPTAGNQWKRLWTQTLSDPPKSAAVTR